MPLPLLIIGGAVATGVLGLVKSYRAYSDTVEARTLSEAAEATFKEAEQRLRNVRAHCTKDLETLGRLKFSIWDRQLGRFVSLFGQLRHVELSGASTVGQLGALSFSQNDLAKMKELSNLAGEVVGGGAVSLGTGALVGMASYGGATMLATASTGTAISSLSGVAATNATLAWFGGGALSAGGAGIAGGIAVLGGIVAAPVLAVGGMMLASQARRKLANARRQQAKAEQAASEMRMATAVVDGIRQVARQVRDVTTQLDERTTRVLDRLAGVMARSGTDYARYTETERRQVHMAVMFATGLKTVLETPILTQEGALGQQYPKALEHGRRLLGVDE